MLVEAEVTGALIEERRLVGVITSDGREHRAEHVVLATGAWSGAAPWLPPSARPGAPGEGADPHPPGSPDQPVSERIVASEHVYLVPRADGRLIVGSTVEERGFDIEVTAGASRAASRGLPCVPEVAELELPGTARASAGDAGQLSPDRPSAVDGLLATGHHRNGILLTPITAEAVAARRRGAPAAGRPGGAPGPLRGRDRPGPGAAPSAEEALR